MFNKEPPRPNTDPILFLDKSTVTQMPNTSPPAPVAPPTAADILERMADTYRERQKQYGSNYKMVGPMVRLLFPNGVPSELVTSDKWHIFELVLVKISRFAISDLTHTDSVHDLSVYGAMLEALILEESTPA